MGIRIKNLHNYILDLVYPGTVATGSNKAVAVAPFAGKISNVFATMSDPGTGATSAVFDVNKNGTTIFSAATKITVAATTGVQSYSALTSEPTNVAAGDIFTLDCDTKSTTGTNACVSIVITRTNMGSVSTASDIDEVL